MRHPAIDGIRRSPLAALGLSLALAALSYRYTERPLLAR